MTSPNPEMVRPYEGRTWCALLTKARHEKKVAGVCERRGIPSYLPLYLHRTFSGGKINTFYLPMFPGYVFASLATGDILPLKQTNSVAQKIEPHNEGCLLHDLQQVLIIEKAQVELEKVTTFKKGQRVLVSSGPLAGISGIVVRQKNRARLQVIIETINQAILIDVAHDALVPM